MSGELPIGSAAVGSSLTEGEAPSLLFFDPMQTVISQYANSPVLLGLVMAFADAVDGRRFFDAFYDKVWNIDTAEGFGLDTWGRIVGVKRVLQVPVGGYLGFSEDPQAQPFGSGVFYSGGNLTSSYYLSDAAYRRLILAKAAANITDGSIPSFNMILLTLFPSYGNSYVRDGGDMTMTIVLGGAPSLVDLAIIQQSGVLPRPAGVSFTVEHP